MKGRWAGQPLEIHNLVKSLRCSVIAATLLLAMTAGAFANPAGGTVTAGAATVQSNKKTATMTITQTTDKLSMNWQRFNIGINETVRFVQPSTSAIALNRVTGWLPSTIYGNLAANGKVFLINPNGILFGSTAQVNVGGLVASTLNLSNSDFLAGRYSFSGTGSLVINQGKITATDGGYVALIGPWVQNQGVIVANMGTVALGAGSAVTLDMTGDGLVNLAVNKAALLANAANSNLIQADGGKVIMNALTADFLAGTVVNNSGIIRARSIGSVNGVISLDGGTNGTVVNSGGLNAAGVASGGNIYLQGKKVNLASSSTIDASGTVGGTLKVSTFGDLTVANPLSAGANANIVLRADYTGTSNGTVLFSGRGLVALNGNGTTEIYYNPTSYTNPTDYTAKVSGGPLTAYMLVNDVYQLQNVNTNLSGNYVLGRNIDAGMTNTWNGGAGFVPINDFTGRINGDGRVVRNLYINRQTEDYVGLFGSTTTATIANLGLANVAISGKAMVGGLVGHNRGGNIINSYVAGTVSGIDSVGGLVGYNSDLARITNSYAAGAVSGAKYIGGLIGYNIDSDINHSYSSISASNYFEGSYTGGLVGYNHNGSIGNSHSAGAVSGRYFVGGLVGSNGGNISNSYSDSGVYGSYYVGGLTGNNSGVISSSYFAGGVGGPYYGNNFGGLAGSNGGSIVNSYNIAGVGGGSDNVGGLTGSNGGFISNSYNSGSVYGENFVGGLTGRNGGNIDNSFSTGRVDGGPNYLGGLVGYNDGIIKRSYSTGFVYAMAKYVGGLVGFNAGEISNSYSTGGVDESATFSGGLVGHNVGSITNCYSTGKVGSLFANDSGGLIGVNSGSIINSYWDVTTSGQTSSAGGIALTTAQMKNQASYPGWDFFNIWNISPGTYPYLR